MITNLSAVYRKRCKVERWSKIITFIVISIVAYIGYRYKIDPLIALFTVNICWFWVPDVAAYILETVQKIPHKFDAYR